jgi:hypothetical protein
LRVALEVEHQQIFSAFRYAQEMFGPRYAVVARTEMVSPEQETGLNSLLAVCVEGRVLVAGALSSLLDYPENAGCLGAAKSTSPL